MPDREPLKVDDHYADMWRWARTTPEASNTVPQSPSTPDCQEPRGSTR